MKSSDLTFRFLIAILFSLLIMLFDSFSWLGWFRAATETVFRPEIKILSSVSAGINRSVDSAKYISSGPARIADLERRLVAAERQAITSARRQEKTAAASILGWADSRGFSLIPAQVLSSGSQLIIEIPMNQFQNWDPAERPHPELAEGEDVGRGAAKRQDPNNSKSFEIGSVVVSPDGALVGSVAAAGRWAARVKLLSDSASQIPVAVLNPDKQKLTNGILTGSFGAAVTLEKVLTEINLEPDLAIVTTGEDGLFPPDLLIGWIGKTGHKETSSVYQTAQVVPAAKPAELKMVFIIMNQ